MNCIVNGVTKSWTLLSDFHFHPAYKLNSTVVFILPWSGKCSELDSLKQKAFLYPNDL